jgi:hypothetical protein
MSPHIVFIRFFLDYPGKHRAPDGQRVTKHTPGAVGVKTKSPIWWGKYRDANHIEQRVRLCENKEAARQYIGRRAAYAPCTDWCQNMQVNANR